MSAIYQLDLKQHNYPFYASISSTLEWGNNRTAVRTDWVIMWRAFSTILGLQSVFSTMTIMTISSSPPPSSSSELVSFSVHWEVKRYFQCIFVFTSIKYCLPAPLQTWEQPWLWLVLPKEFFEILPAAWRPWKYPVVSGQCGRHDIAFSLPAGIAFSIVNHAEAETQQ